MENKKTLWIIAAVGAFLLVVLGAALICYSPTAKSSQTVARVSPAERQNNIRTNPGFENNGFTPAPSSVEHQLNFPSHELPQPGEPLKVNEVYLVADKANVYEMPSNGTTIDLNSLKELKTEDSEKNINVTVTFADQGKPAADRERPPRDFEKSAPRQEVASNSAKSTSVTAKKSETKKAAAKPAAKAPAGPVKYWVQVAAYSNKKGAENARSTLGTNQIQADIFTYKDNKENLFYRVRVGPYTTKSEAEYWRQKIARINDFASAKSYVTSTN
ncbi:SPOR domain-containing protein [Treponema sp. C6A8]|uniref:SPOR domain-containing protein n=1 Tax=Treponema sp. C6A8 TaxID=1410609 RepID=UPI00048A16BA|nr:SPOR domain-containing protein [Treponema sp. C6A8]